MMGSAAHFEPDLTPKVSVECTRSPQGCQSFGAGGCPMYSPAEPGWWHVPEWKSPTG